MNLESGKLCRFLDAYARLHFQDPTWPFPEPVMSFWILIGFSYLGPGPGIETSMSPGPDSRMMMLDNDDDDDDDDEDYVDSGGDGDGDYDASSDDGMMAVLLMKTNHIDNVDNDEALMMTLMMTMLMMVIKMTLTLADDAFDSPDPSSMNRGFASKWGPGGSPGGRGGRYT